MVCVAADINLTGSAKVAVQRWRTPGREILKKKKKTTERFYPKLECCCFQNWPERGLPAAARPIDLRRRWAIYRPSDEGRGANVALPRSCAKFREMTPRSGFLESIARAFEARGHVAWLCREDRNSTASIRAARLRTLRRMSKKQVHLKFTVWERL